jgi:hypothetical protein
MDPWQCRSHDPGLVSKPYNNAWRPPGVYGSRNRQDTSGVQRQPFDTADRARLNPDPGNGIVIFETGDASLASDIATQWTLWETGKPDMYILRNALPVMFKRILIGYVII